MAQKTKDSDEDEDGGGAVRSGNNGGGQVQVVCSADVLLPFINNTQPLELLDDTSITVLPYSSSHPSPSTSSSLPVPTSRWWLCDLLRCDDIPGVQTAIDLLTHSSNEWAVGWQAHQPHSATASLTSLSSSSCAATSSRRSRSAATFAVLRVVQQLNPKQYRSTAVSPHSALTQSSPADTTSFPQTALAVMPAGFPSVPPIAFVSSRSLRRGCDVHVIASPYGFLSPAVFHNSVSGGIVSNVVYPSTAAVMSGESSAALSDGDASFDSVTMRDTIVQTSFPSADVSFPRHLHFPIQGHPTSSAPSSPAPRSSLAVEHRIASVFLTDCRCLPGSEGGPVVLSSTAIALSPSSSVLLAGLVTLPLHLTNALSPVLLNNVVSAEAVWHWLHQDERTVPNPRFHSLGPSMSVAVVSPLTSSPTAPSAFLPPTPSPSSVSSKSVSSSSPSLSVSPVSASRVNVSGMVERAERSLAIAKVESSWASAIVLTADGYIATNAHLLAPFHTATTASAADPSPVSVSAPSLSATVSVCLPTSTVSPVRSRRWYKATVVYVCRAPWDLALLKIDPPTPLTPVALPLPSSEPARPGDPVYVLGHALFSPSSMLLPTLTRGVLSQCVSLVSASASSSSALSRSPVLLQTDSAVHNGNSGGLLLSRTGVCLGMVTSNIQHTALPTAPDSPNPPPASTTLNPSSSVIIPQLNLSIPSAVLARLRSRVQPQVAAGGGDVWREWEAGESVWRTDVERVWGLSVVDVWEADVKPRSSKYREVVEMVQRMEREKQSQQPQHEQHEQQRQQSREAHESAAKETVSHLARL